MASSGDRFTRAAAGRGTVVSHKRVEDVLKFKDEGLSVEEAKKAMIAAGEAPRGIAGVRTGAQPTATVVVEETPTTQVLPTTDENFDDELEIQSSPDMTTEPQPKPRVVVPTAPPAPAPQRPTVERVETDKFVGEIRQEGGKWVAELTYKNGGGVERWVAPKKNDLMLELLKGKGHATLRVKEAVRREKLGSSADLDKYYPLPDGISAEAFDKLPEEQQHAMLYTIASQQTLAFRDAHPEFYATSKNAAMINDFLTRRQLPITVKNLDFAYQDLQDNDLLEVRPGAPVPTPVAPSLEPAPTPQPARTDSVPAVVTPAAVPTATPAALPPGAVVRKRGYPTGLQPGQSSTPSELERTTEAGDKDRELSEAELRKLSEIGKPVSAELKRRAQASRIANALRR
jgi:hypothetical protein